VTDIRCYRDGLGFRRAEVVGGDQTIGSFLESDIQGSINGCKEYLNIIKSIRGGETQEWSGTGNAYAIDITRDAVRIENLWVENANTAEVSLIDFESCIRSWMEFVSKPS